MTVCRFFSTLQLTVKNMNCGSHCVGVGSRCLILLSESSLPYISLFVEQFQDSGGLGGESRCRGHTVQILFPVVEAENFVRLVWCSLPPEEQPTE